MDNLIKELVEEFKKQEKKIEKESEKRNEENKIAVKVNKKGDVEVMAVYGSESALLSTICLILKEMSKYSENSAEHMAMIILTTLEMEKKMHE